MENNPFRVIPLLSDSSPCRGNIFQVQGELEKTAHLETDFEESRVVAWMIFGIICIRILDFNICLYKSVINY